MNSVKSPCCPRVLVAQWIECPPGVRKVMGSIPVGQIFSLSHARVMLIISLFTLLKLFITFLILFTILGLWFGKLSQMTNSEIIITKLIAGEPWRESSLFFTMVRKSQNLSGCKIGDMRSRLCFFLYPGIPGCL